MKLVSMAMTPEEAKKEYPSSTMLGGDDKEDERPKYPYGLTICLCDESLQKLGITDLPKVGTKLMVTAMVEVSNTAQRETQGGVDSDLGLQITDMAIAGAPDKTSAQNLYSASNMNP